MECHRGDRGVILTETSFMARPSAAKSLSSMLEPLRPAIRTARSSSSSIWLRMLFIWFDISFTELLDALCIMSGRTNNNNNNNNGCR